MLHNKNQVNLESRYAFQGQKYRCYNKNASSFKYYGKKGIKVIYSYKEFKKWFIEERKKFSLNISVSVDRINANGNYEFGNIRLVTVGQNTSEANFRRSKITIFHILSHLDEGLTQSEIARMYGLKPQSIIKHLKINGFPTARQMQSKHYGS